MKCAICKTEIEKTFLDKRIGTVVKNKKGKKHDICPACQKKYADKEQILEKL